MSCHFQFRLFQNPYFALECNPPGISQPLVSFNLNSYSMFSHPFLNSMPSLGSSVTPPRFPQVRLIPRSMGLSLFNPTGPNLLPRNPVSISVPDLLRSENLPFSAVDASPRPADPVSPQVASLSANESSWVSPLVHILGNLLSSANIVLSGVPVNAAADGLTEEPQAGSPEASAPRASREDMRCRYTEFSPIHHFTNITPNGELQEHSCVDAEYSRRPECDPGPRQVCFSPNTTATVTIQIRPVVGSNESIVHHLGFHYNQSGRVLTRRLPGLGSVPGLNQLPALILRGFFGTDPQGLASPCRSSLEQTLCNGLIGTAGLEDVVPRPAASYFNLRYAFADPENPLPSPRVQSMSQPASTEGLAVQPLLQFTVSERGLERHPLQQLITRVARDFGQDSLDGFLESLGLNGRESRLYRSLGVPVGGLPRSVLGFLTLVRPLFTADSRERVDRQSTTWNPNTVLDQNPLFLWRQTRHVRIDGLIRSGALDFPGGVQLNLEDRRQFGERLQLDQTRFNENPPQDPLEQNLQSRDLELRTRFSRAHPVSSSVNRLRVEGNESELTAGFEGVNFSSIHIPMPDTLNHERSNLDLNGLSADRISIELPPLEDLMSDVSIDSRPFRRLTLENPYISSMRVQYGTIELTLRNIHAQRIEYVLPNLTEIQRNGWNAQQAMRHGRLIVQGLEADYLHLANPLYQLEGSMRNVRIQMDPSSGAEGRRLSTEESQTLPFQISSLQAGETRFSMRGLGTLTARETNLQGIDLAFLPNQLRASVQRIFSSGTIRYDMNPTEGTSIEMAGASEITNLRYQSTYDEQGPRGLNLDFNISTTINGGTLEVAPPSRIVLRESTLRNASFHSEVTFPQSAEGAYTYQNRLQGDLSLNIERIQNFQNSFNIPGFLFSGNFENIRLNGPARIQYGDSGWSIERSGDASHPLQFDALIQNTRVTHNPSVSDSELRRTPNSSAVLTDMNVANANFHVADFTRIAQRRDESGAHSQMDIHIHGIQLTDLQTWGEIWAELPPWRYMRGILSIGRSYPHLQRDTAMGSIPQSPGCSSLPGGVPTGINSPNNFIYLGEWETTRNTRGRVQTTLSDLRTCLHSEPISTSGARPFIIVSVPSLTINPNSNSAVSSNNTQLHLDTFLFDRTRGGWMHLSPAPRR